MIERKQQRSANEDAYLKAMRTYQALDAAALSPNQNDVAKELVLFEVGCIMGKIKRDDAVWAASSHGDSVTNPDVVVDGALDGMGGDATVCVASALGDTVTDPGVVTDDGESVTDAGDFQEQLNS